MTDAAMDALESTVARLPGGASPEVRALWGAGIGAALVYGLKPDFMFTKTGATKPWSVTHPGAGSTPFPAWMGVVLPAFILGVLI